MFYRYGCEKSFNAMQAGTYTRIPDMYPAAMVVVTL